MPQPTITDARPSHPAHTRGTTTGSDRYGRIRSQVIAALRELAKAVEHASRQPERRIDELLAAGTPDCPSLRGLVRDAALEHADALEFVARVRRVTSELSSRPERMVLAREIAPLKRDGLLLLQAARVRLGLIEQVLA